MSKPTDGAKERIKPGDTVYCRCYAETWVVAAISPNGKELMCAGWPPTIVPIDECDLVESCSGDESREMLRQCMNSLAGSDIRRAWARAAWEKKPEMCVMNSI